MKGFLVIAASGLICGFVCGALVRDASIVVRSVALIGAWSLGYWSAAIAERMDRR